MGDVSLQELEQLRKQLLETLRAADYEVYCEEDAEGNKICERYTCSKYDNCKLVEDWVETWWKCYKLIERFARERGLEAEKPKDSGVWTPISNMCFIHSIYFVCLGVIHTNEEIHFHALGREGRAFNKRYSITDNVEIVAEGASLF